MHFSDKFVIYINAWLLILTPLRKLFSKKLILWYKKSRLTKVSRIQFSRYHGHIPEEVLGPEFRT